MTPVLLFGSSLPGSYAKRAKVGDLISSPSAHLQQIASSRLSAGTPFRVYIRAIAAFNGMRPVQLEAEGGWGGDKAKETNAEERI